LEALRNFGGLNPPNPPRYATEKNSVEIFGGFPHSNFSPQPVTLIEISYIFSFCPVKDVMVPQIKLRPSSISFPMPQNNIPVFRRYTGCFKRNLPYFARTFLWLKDKCKFFALQDRCGPEGGWRYSSTLP